MRRVVAGADRVDVELLHERQIRAGKVLVEDAAPVRVGLMPVHAMEHHPPAVHQETVPDDLHRPETQAQRDGLAGAGHRGVVEPRQFSGPRFHWVDPDRGNIRRRVPSDVHAQLRHGKRYREGIPIRRDFSVDRTRTGVA